jgi:hypothetical protein
MSVIKHLLIKYKLKAMHLHHAWSSLGNMCVQPCG